MCAGGLGEVRGEVLVLAEGGVRVLEVLLRGRERELLLRHAGLRRRARPGRVGVTDLKMLVLGCIEAKFCKFESSRRDLHNALLCTALKSHFFLKICQNCI